jgi:hypothetical protein
MTRISDATITLEKDEICAVTHNVIGGKNCLRCFFFLRESDTVIVCSCHFLMAILEDKEM